MVLTPEQKKRFLKIARPRLDKCITCDKKTLKEVKQGLRTGEISEKVLSRFPDAYPGVLSRKKQGDPDPVLSYFLKDHNIKRIIWYQKTRKEEYKQCLVVPGKVIGEKEGMLLVQAPDGIHTARKRKGFKKGTRVLVHDGEVVETLDEKEYKKASRIYSKVMKSLDS